VTCGDDASEKGKLVNYDTSGAGEVTDRDLYLGKSPQSRGGGKVNIIPELPCKERICSALMPNVMAQGSHQ